VHVLEEQQRGVVQDRAEEGADDSVQARAAEGRIELLRLRSPQHLSVQREREQRDPRQELRIDLLEPAAQTLAVLVGSPVQLDPDQVAEEISEGVIRRRRFVLLAGRADAAELGRALH
jgi:hypothetical protein